MTLIPDDAPEIDSAILLRYLAGECDNREAATVQAWLLANPANGAHFDALSRAWALAGEVPPVPDTKAIWERLVAKLEDPRRNIVRGQIFAHSPSVVRPRFDGLSHYRTSGFRWRRAAVVLIALSMGPLAWWISGKSMTRDDGQMREYRTARGQRAVVHLLDGSRITMAPGTRLRVPSEFNRGSRAVTLEGEALFDVVHDSTQPFLVRLHDAETQDLGTRFVISAYPEDSLAWVAVVEGRVAVRLAASPHHLPAAVLARGDATTILPGGRLRTQHDAAMDSYTSWATGRLVFDNTRLGDALPQLSRWYDTDFRLADEGLADRRLMASIHDEPLSDVLKQLALSLDLNIERHGDVVVLSARRGSQDN
jgi:transmembrane sensor